MIKLQIALIPPNCHPIYTYSNYNMMMMMSAMNPYSAMMNPYAAMFQQQQQRVPMMQPNMPFPMPNPFSLQNSQILSQEPNMSGSLFSQPQPQVQQNNSIEFHPKVLTFNVFIDSSKTILQLAEAIYAKSSRLYPNLKRPIEILKIKDFEKNDLAVEDLISENFTGSLRKTVLCIIKNPLDFNKTKNYRFSYLSSEAEKDGSCEEDEGDDNIDNSDIYSTHNEHEGNQTDSRINSMTQLQLSRKRNVSLVYENKQKVPSLIVQKKRKSMLLNGNFQSEPINPAVQPEESVLPPPVERSPQMRISSNIGETRKRIFSTNLGQSNDAVSRSEEVDPDKRKTIDMVFDEFDNNRIPRETPSKEATNLANAQSQPKINLYDATPNRFNSRIVSASNTVVKSQPIQNMIASVQRHTMSPQSKPVKSANGPTSPTAHGKLDSKGAGEPILQSPGVGVLPPRADRIPMKQGLDVDMDPYPSSSSDSEDGSKETGEKGNHLEAGGDLTPLNVKTASSLQVSEESPIRIGESNRSLVKLAKLPNKADRDQIEKSEDDVMDVDNVSVVLSTLEEAPVPLPVENGRTKRKAALAAAGRMDNKSVRVTDADGKEVLVPYNKVSSFMKKNNNNLFDTLSSSNESLKEDNPITSENTAEKNVTALPTSEDPLEQSKTLDPKNVEHNEKEVSEEMDVETVSNASEDSNGSESDATSGSGSDSDSEDEEESKASPLKTRKVAADTANKSQRVPSARQQLLKQKSDLKVVKPERIVKKDNAEKKNEKLSTLQRMRLHKQTALLGSFSDLAARGIPPVHDKAAENRLMVEKKRKEEEQKKKQQQEKAAEKSQSDSEESSSDDSDSESASSDDSDSDSEEKNDKSKPNFIKKAKKKSSNAFASLVKDSKKI